MVVVNGYCSKRPEEVTNAAFFVVCVVVFLFEAVLGGVGVDADEVLGDFREEVGDEVGVWVRV